MKVFNTTDSPVVIDDEGRILGGGEHYEFDGRSQTPQIKKALEKGWLLRTDEPEPEPEPDPEPARDTMTADSSKTTRTSKKG